MGGTDKPIEWRERPYWIRVLPPLAGVGFVYLVRWIFGLPAWYAVVAGIFAGPVVVAVIAVRSMRQLAMVVGFMVVGVAAGWAMARVVVLH